MFNARSIGGEINIIKLAFKSLWIHHEMSRYYGRVKKISYKCY